MMTTDEGWTEHWRNSEGYAKAMDHVARRMAELDAKQEAADTRAREQTPSPGGGTTALLAVTILLVLSVFLIL